MSVAAVKGSVASGPAAAPLWRTRTGCARQCDTHAEAAHRVQSAPCPVSRQRHGRNPSAPPSSDAVAGAGAGAPSGGGSASTPGGPAASQSQAAGSGNAPEQHSSGSSATAGSASQSQPDGSEKDAEQPGSAAIMASQRGEAHAQAGVRAHAAVQLGATQGLAAPLRGACAGSPRRTLHSIATWQRALWRERSASAGVRRACASTQALAQKRATQIADGAEHRGAAAHVARTRASSRASG